MNSIEIRTRSTADLESDIRIEFDQLEVLTETQDLVFQTLLPLKEKSEAHHDFYKHSLRNELMFGEAAKILGLDQKASVFGGFLHDTGKIFLPTTLYEPHDWTPKDIQLSRTHVMLGYDLIRDTFPVPAEIMLYHHMFQLHTYPEVMPVSSIPYSPNNDGSILDLSRELLAVIDAYDALHRPHYNGSGMPFYLSDQTIRDKMMMIHHDRSITVVYLYESGVFDNAEKVKPAAATTQLQ